MKPLDRRRTLRLPCNLPVAWRRGTRKTVMRAHDINADGIFLISDEVVELNLVLDLVVTLPSETIEMLAVSRFCGVSRWGHGIGVEVHAIALSDRAAWQRYYRRRLEEAARALPPSVAENLLRGR